MITMHLDWHDFLAAVEGFAHGSHLRQHIWEKIINHYIQQMSDLEQDTLWFFFRRDIFPLYFESNYHQCGDNDFLQCLAAMHRGNYALVTFREQGKKNGKHHISRCYRFQNEWRPENRFRSVIPEEWIVRVNPDPKAPAEPLYIESGKEHWWHDRDIYNTNPEELRLQTIAAENR